MKFKDTNDNLCVCTPIELIRTLSGVFSYTLDSTINNLATINMICRVLEKDADKEFANEVLNKMGIRVNWEGEK